MDVSWWNDPSALIILLVLAMKHSSQLSSRTLAFASTIQPLVLLCISFFFSICGVRPLPCYMEDDPAPDGKLWL